MDQPNTNCSFSYSYRFKNRTEYDMQIDLLKYYMIVVVIFTLFGTINDISSSENNFKNLKKKQNENNNL